MNNMPEHDIVLYGVDQFLPQKVQNQKRIFDKVDEVMTESISAGDPEIAGRFMESLLGVSQISGLAFSKFVYVMSFQWSKFNRRDSFIDFAEERFGRKKKAIKDNFRVWEMLVSADIPKEYSEKLKIMPIRCLIPIANMWSQGYEIESNQWMKLCNAPDPTTINKLCREIKGKPAKAGSLQIEMSSDGSLYAWKDDIRYFVGHLNVEDESEVVQAAIERLTSEKVLERG